MKNVLRKLVLALVIFTSIVEATAQTTANWQSLGPIAFPTNRIGQINGMGRVVQMKYHPSTANKAYAVSVSSAFVTVNNTDTWSVLPGINTMPPATSCASICIDYSNPNVLYLGTGDPNYYNSNRARGVWKSTDGGNTFTSSNNGMGNVLVIDIVQSPTNSNTLVAATINGMYKSTDGGANWTRQSSVVNITGFAANKAANSQTLYFSTGEAGSVGTFYTSTDFGTTWTQNTSFTTPTLTYRGARIATTPANPNVVYVSFVGSGAGGAGGSSTVGGGIVYKSTNGGTTFTLQKGDVQPNLNGYSASTTGQGNYNYDIAASPANENLLIASGHLIWKSTDGGVNWTQMQSSWALVIHTDMHHTVFNPNNPNEIFNCNDGGVWKSTDGASTWTQKNQNLVSTEFYHFANSRNFSGVMGGGTQDNGEVYFKDNEWNCNRGGDWTSEYFTSIIAGTNERVIYSNNANARNLHTLPFGSGSQRSLNAPFITDSEDQYAFSYQNPDVGFILHNNITSGTPSETGKGGVYRTTNLTAVTTGNPVWSNIIPYTDGSVQLSLEVNPTNADTVYFVARNKSISRINNALAASPIATIVKSGTDLSTEFGLPSTVSTADLEIMKNGVLYVALNGKVLRSNNAGANWTDYTGTTTSIYTALPSTTNFFEIIQDSTQKNESIYAASSNAVYYRNNTMPGWILFTNNLPSTPNFTDIDIYNDPNNILNDRLRLSTYGRGVWETNTYKTNVVLAPAFKFLTLTATQQQGSNNIVWTTQNDVSILNYEVERSLDNINFTKIGTILSKETTVIENRYQYIDYFKRKVTVYYRIKIIAKNGSVSYSNVVSITSGNQPANKFTILSNPSNSKDVRAILNTTVTQPQQVSILVFDAIGKIVSSQQVQVSAEAQIFLLNTNIQSKGIYLVKAVFADGSSITERLIVN